MVVHLFKTMRPTNWIKNLFVFAPLFFSGHFTEANKFVSVFVIFISFCAMASAVYCLNDIMDRERDRSHPEKCKRPIASGALPVKNGLLLCLGLGIVSFAFSYTVGLPPMLILLLYTVINLLYSIWLKHIVILDVFCICWSVIMVGHDNLLASPFPCFGQTSSRTGSFRRQC
jgi:4-hydroxybenzoate polyprenyltransferase